MAVSPAIRQAYLATSVTDKVFVCQFILLSCLFSLRVAFRWAANICMYNLNCINSVDGLSECVNIDETVTVYVRIRNV